MENDQLCNYSAEKSLYTAVVIDGMDIDGTH